MSLYNALFGVNPYAPLLMGFLGVGPGDVPRFRDCYIEDGKIAIHTRTGGGNRAFYENEARCKAEYPEYFDGSEDAPSGPWNDDLRGLPGFTYDRDDDFDCTYATFYYNPSPEVAKLVAQLGEIGGSQNPGERWQKLFADMHDNKENAQVARALEVGKPIIEAITSHFAATDTQPEPTK